MVFVLDKHKKPLMPWSPKRARLLLARRRAVVHRLSPFVIRLKDRRVAESTLQPVALKVDPGSKTSGLALVREEAMEGGQFHHALHLSEVHHRGAVVHQAMLWRRRGGANLRYREPRFDHRRRRQAWLPPSLISRVGNILSWARRYSRCAPVRRIEVERVKFDLQLLQNPEISGIEYQRGELVGWETRAYLLEKFEKLGLPIGSWSGGRTRRNRAAFGIFKTHALGALCLGDPVGVDAGKLKTVVITATGRGRYARTNVDECGFPRGYLMCQKQVRGIKTGDRVRVAVPAGFAACGTYTGRISVRANGQFRMGKVQGIPARFCRVLQRAAWYDYALVFGDII